MSRTLYFIQPMLPAYRSELLLALSAKHKLVVLSDCSRDGKMGFSPAATPVNLVRIDARVFDLFRGKVRYQAEVLKQRYRSSDAVIVCADPRSISMWLLLIFARIKKTKVFAHGQGSYAYPSASIFRKLMYRLICKLSYRYICYNEFVRSAMLKVGCDAEKLVVADNSVEVSSLVLPADRDFTVNGILFVGRLRHGCRLEAAVNAVSAIRSKVPNACLHVIGGGPDEQRLRDLFSDHEWVHFHGAIFDSGEIADISLKCRIGCYPGNAGLSVVHYFGLSLPVVVHSEISLHMGPEPAYVVDGVNGFLFKPSVDLDGVLAQALLRAWNVPIAELREIGARAFETYRKLTTPSLGERFLSILDAGGVERASPTGKTQ